MSVKKCNKTNFWKADFRVNGKRIRQTFETREEARDFETSAKLTAKLGVEVAEDSGILLSEGISQFSELKTSKKVSKSDEKSFLRSFYQYMTHIENLTTFSQVKLIHLNRYQSHLQNSADRELLWNKVESALKSESGNSYIPREKPIEFKALSGSSVNRHFNSICALFSQAKKWGWIATDPTSDLDAVMENPVERKPWPSDVHIQTAIDMAKPWASRIFFFIARTGVRPVACKKMEWSHVDFDGRRFMVISLKGKKGDLREQWIPMTHDVLEFFKYMWANRQVGKYGHLVFHSAAGCPVDTKRLAREMALVTKKMGIIGYTLYGFRHSFVTNIANPSEDGSRTGNLEAARQAAGHASISQTQRYNHTADWVIRDELERVSLQRKIVFKGGK